MSPVGRELGWLESSLGTDGNKMMALSDEIDFLPWDKAILSLPKAS